MGIPKSKVWDQFLGGVVKTTTPRAEKESSKINNQGNRGAVIGREDGPKILAALEKPNKSTALHELAHLFQGQLDIILPDARQIVLDEFDKFNGDDVGTTKEWTKGCLLYTSDAADE